MSLTTALTVAILAACASCLVALLPLRGYLRGRRLPLPAPADPVGLTAPREVLAGAALHQQLFDRIADMDMRHGEVLDRINDMTYSLQSDLEWLTGERMIEQAIDMARNGLDAQAISDELGMTREDAGAVLRFRRH